MVSVDEIADRLYALLPEEFTLPSPNGKRSRSWSASAGSRSGQPSKPRPSMTTLRATCSLRLVREPEGAGFGTLLAHSEPKAAKASTAARAATGTAGRSRPREARRTPTRGPPPPRRLRPRKRLAGFIDGAIESGLKQARTQPSSPEPVSSQHRSCAQNGDVVKLDLGGASDQRSEVAQRLRTD
jgi:hypothetical protein